MEDNKINEMNTKVEPKADESKVEEPKKEQPKEKLFTQADVDKIVEKRLAKEKQKAEAEKAESERLAQMNAEEKMRYDYEKKNKELEDKIREYNTKELKQTSIGILNEKGYSMETAKALSELLNYADAEQCKASIDKLDMALRECIEREVNSKLKASNNVAPKLASKSNGTITWDDVIKNPKLLSEYKKQQNK